MDKKIRGFGARPLEYFSEEQMGEIHSASMDILEDLGTVVHHDEALMLLKEAGAYVMDEGRVRIPTALVERAIRTAPSRVTIYDRNVKQNRKFWNSVGGGVVLRNAESVSLCGSTLSTPWF